MRKLTNYHRTIIYTGGRPNNKNTMQYSYKLLYVGCIVLFLLIWRNISILLEYSCYLLYISVLHKLYYEH